jgi:hypothetical protein
MGLPAIIRGKASVKLERAMAERDKITAAVGELQSKRAALDIEADDYATARRAFDERIAVQEGILRIINDQIAALESKVAADERAAAAVRRAQAIRAVQSMLPERAKIVAEIEAAVKDLPGLFDKLAKWQRGFVSKYPSGDLEYPFQHYLDDDRVIRNVTAALHVIRIEDAVESIDGLAAAEAQQHADLIADLQQNSAPHIEPEAA